MDKKQKEERRHQEDVALNKGLVWVGAAIVLEVLLLLVKRFYIDADLSDMGVNVMLALDSALRGMRLVLPAAAVLCAVWAVLWFKNGKKVILPVALAAALGSVGICAHVVVRFQASGMQMLFLLVRAGLTEYGVANNGSVMSNSKINYYSVEQGTNDSNVRMRINSARRELVLLFPKEQQGLFEAYMVKNKVPTLEAYREAKKKKD